MFLFLRLILAHLIADFVFQFPDVIYQSKFRVGFLGFAPILHGLIVGATAFVFGWPYYNNPSFWGLVLYLALSHHVLDQAKILLEKKSPAWNSLLGFFADQCVHVTLMLPVFVIAPLRTPPSEQFFQKITSASQGPLLRYLIGLYTNDMIIFFAMGLVASTIGGTIIIHYLRKTFKTPGHDLGISLKDKYLGPLERTIIFMLAFVASQYVLGFGNASVPQVSEALMFFVWIPVIGVVRWAATARRRAHPDTTEPPTSSLLDIVTSVAWATFIGLVAPCLYFISI